MEFFRLKSIKNKGHYAVLFAALLLCLWIPLYKNVLPAFIVFWILVLVFTMILKKEKVKKPSRYELILFSLQIFFFLIIVSGIFLSDSKSKAVDVVIKKMSIFVFPLLFFFSKNYIKKHKDLFLKIFIIGNLLASLVCLTLALYNSINFTDGSLSFHPLDRYSNNYFQYTLFSIFHHPSYFSMYIVFSVISLFILNKQNQFKKKFFKISFIILILFFIIVIYMLSSRVGIITLVLVFVWRYFEYIKKTRNLFIVLLGVILLTSSVLFFLNNDRFKRKSYELKLIFENKEKSEDYPIRFILWEASVDVIRDNFIAGTGTGDAQSVFSEYVEKINFKKEKISYLNAHNQYLETFMSSGLIGILTLSAILILGLIYAIKKRNQAFLLFMILMILNFSFESMLNTIAGIVFFSFFLNYFIFIKDHIQANEVVSEKYS